MKIIYHCYGGSHSSVIAAALHLGLLAKDRIPNETELMAIPYFDKPLMPILVQYVLWARMNIIMKFMFWERRMGETVTPICLEVLPEYWGRKNNCWQ